MSFSRNHAIIVSSWCSTSIELAHKKAVEIGLEKLVTRVVPHIINGGASFAVLPDGSNEGWIASELCDTLRGQFVAWMRTTYHADGSSALKWVEVQFGDEELETKVVGSSDDDRARVEAALPVPETTDRG